MEANDKMSGVDRFLEALDKMVGEWFRGSGVEVSAPVTGKSDVMVDYPYDLPPVVECTTEEVPFQSVLDDSGVIQSVPIPALGTLEELTGRRRR